MKNVSVFTEAASFENSPKGGYAAVFLQPNGIFEIAGQLDDTTLNGLRITAATEALNAITQPSDVRVCSRSKYLVRAVKLGWLAKWSTNGWRMGRGTDVSHVALWQALLEAIARHEAVTFAWMRHQASNQYNEHAHRLAVEAVTGCTFDLRGGTLGGRTGNSRSAAIISVSF